MLSITFNKINENKGRQMGYTEKKLRVKACNYCKANRVEIIHELRGVAAGGGGGGLN